MEIFEIQIKQIYNTRVTIVANSIEQAIEKSYNGEGVIVSEEFYDYLDDSSIPYPV